MISGQRQIDTKHCTEPGANRGRLIKPTAPAPQYNGVQWSSCSGQLRGQPQSLAPGRHLAHVTQGNYKPLARLASSTRSAVPLTKGVPACGLPGHATLGPAPNPTGCAAPACRACVVARWQHAWATSTTGLECRALWRWKRLRLRNMQGSPVSCPTSKSQRGVRTNVDKENMANASSKVSTPLLTK